MVRGAYSMIGLRGVFSLCVVILFFFTSSFASAFDNSKMILGEIASNGMVDIERGPDQWMPLKGKSLPVFDGARFRSADGTMSLILNDVSRVAVARDTNITIMGSAWGIAVFLKTGTIGCSTPDGSHLSITTPSASIQISSSEIPRMVSYSLPEKGYTKTLVTVDDKGSRIAVLEGTLLVLDEDKVVVKKMSAGDVVDVSSKKGQGFTQVAALDQAAKADSSAPSNPYGSFFSSTMLWAAVGALFAIPAAIAISNISKNNTTSSVSPSSP